MSEPGFEELQRVWRTPPAAAVAAEPIVLRQQRRRWLAQLYIAGEIAFTIVAIPSAIWLALQPDGRFFGLGFGLFALLSAAASFWARSVGGARLEDPLLSSVNEGVRRARIGVRLAYSTLWSLVVVMLSIAALGLAWWSTPDISPATARRMILSLAFWCALVGACIGGALIYLRSRSRELTQMLRVRDALDREQ